MVDDCSCTQAPFNIVNTMKVLTTIKGKKKERTLLTEIFCSPTPRKRPALLPFIAYPPIQSPLQCVRTFDSTHFCWQEAAWYKRSFAEGVHHVPRVLQSLSSETLSERHARPSRHAEWLGYYQGCYSTDTHNISTLSSTVEGFSQVSHVKAAFNNNIII